MEGHNCQHAPEHVTCEYWACVACDELYPKQVPTGQPCPKCGKQELLITSREWGPHWRCRLCGMILGRSLAQEF